MCLRDLEDSGPYPSREQLEQVSVNLVGYGYLQRRGLPRGTMYQMGAVPVMGKQGSRGLDGAQLQNSG